jgi:hypothetical protein
MRSSAPVAITPRDRVDRVLGILGDEVGPRLLADRRLSSTAFSIGRRSITVEAASRQGVRLDASDCCKVILAAPAHLFSEIRQTVADVKGIRDRVAHPRWHITELEAVQAATAVAAVLRAFGRAQAANTAERYRVGPMIRYVTSLRGYLIGRCSLQDPLVSYETALSELRKTAHGLKMSEFLRQLNVLAALQMILGEPQLCSLVVLNDLRIPGDGFYWTVGLSPNDTAESKRAAHKREVAAVRRFVWRPSDERYALPW